MCVRLVSFHYLQTHDRNIRGWIFTQWWIIIILKHCSVTYLFSGNLWIFLFIQHTSWCNAFYSICFLYWYFWIQVQYLLEQKLFCLDSCSLYIFICSFVCFYVVFSFFFSQNMCQITEYMIQSHSTVSLQWNLNFLWFLYAMITRFFVIHCHICTVALITSDHLVDLDIIMSVLNQMSRFTNRWSKPLFFRQIWSLFLNYIIPI